MNYEQAVAAFEAAIEIDPKNVEAYKGLVDAYNYCTGDVEGEEVIPTFYLQRKKDKPYHLDRCFVAPERIASFNVAANHDYWLSLSDHIPVEIVIKD
jgi:endonuclease/exonuclease/phosphatase family metal-dependent hydrolase